MEANITINGKPLFTPPGEMRTVGSPAEFVIKDLFVLRDDELDAAINFLIMFRNRGANYIFKPDVKSILKRRDETNNTNQG